VVEERLMLALHWPCEGGSAEAVEMYGHPRFVPVDFLTAEKVEAWRERLASRAHPFLRKARAIGI